MRRAWSLVLLALAACGPVEVGKLTLVLRKGSVDPFNDPGDGVTASRPVAALRLSWDSPLVRWPDDAGVITLPLTASASAKVDLPAPAEAARLTVEGLLTGTEEVWSMGRSARIEPPSGATPSRVTVLLGVADGWTAVAESGGTRLDPLAVRLGETGALVVGGFVPGTDGGMRPPATGGFVYETASSAVTPVSVPALTGGAAVTLPSGAVLYGFGRESSGALSSALWLVDAAGSAREVSLNGGTLEPRVGASMVVLLDGAVLIIGGEGAVAPLTTVTRLTLDETAAQATVNSVASLSAGRARAGATRLSTGEVVVIGGRGANGVAFDDAVWLDPTAAQPVWKSSANRMAAGRVAPQVVRLEDDSVLVWGGATAPGDVFSLLVSSDGAFVRLAGTVSGLTSGAAAIRVGRSVLFTGGEEGVDPPFAARFTPAVQTPVAGQQYAGTWVRLRSPAEARRGGALVRLDDGAVLAVGGAAQKVELFSPTEAFVNGE